MIFFQVFKVELLYNGEKNKTESLPKQTHK